MRVVIPIDSSSYNKQLLEIAMNTYRNYKTVFIFSGNKSEIEITKYSNAHKYEFINFEQEEFNYSKCANEAISKYNDELFVFTDIYSYISIRNIEINAKHLDYDNQYLYVDVYNDELDTPINLNGKKLPAAAIGRAARSTSKSVPSLIVSRYAITKYINGFNELIGDMYGSRFQMKYQLEKFGLDGISCDKRGLALEPYTVNTDIQLQPDSQYLFVPNNSII